MTTVMASGSTVNPNAGGIATVRETESLVTWRAPIALAIFTVLAAVIAIFAGRAGETGFKFGSMTDMLQIAEIKLPSQGTQWFAVIVMTALTVVAVMIVRGKHKVPLWLNVLFVFFFLFGFLAWAAAGASLPMVGLLSGALALAVPLIFGALSGVIGERVGVVNIAIEAQLLSGAFCAVVVASSTGQPWLGLPAAMVAGSLIGMVLGAFSIKYLVDQVIVGVVLNVLVVGVTNFLFSQILSQHANLNQALPIGKWPILVLGDLPIIGPVLFRQTPIVYLMYVALVLVTVGLFRTRWGLRLRAVGEHPQAADTVGIKVNQTRFWNLALAGSIAGFGGAFFTIGSGIAFNKEMTAGAGYIALAAVIFGQWHPIKATLAALLFGFASNLQNSLSVIGSPVPSEFMLMLPYVVTIFAVAGLVGRSRGPAAAGKPYLKG